MFAIRVRLRARARARARYGVSARLTIVTCPPRLNGYRSARSAASALSDDFENLVESFAIEVTQISSTALDYTTGLPNAQMQNTDRACMGL